MSVFHRKALAGIGFTAVTVAATALFAMPAQAASAGQAKVVGSSTVQFNALKGKSNGLTITISGRTVTLNDKVAIKAGKGCKAVKGDKTKVKCTTKKKTTKITAALGDKNDWITNKTSVYLLTDGGSGNDTLTGGSGKDQLQGGSGNDKLYGKGSGDTLFGDSGADAIYGSTGNDRIDAGSGADKAYGDSGDDLLLGGTGADRIVGGTGADDIWGGADVDTVYGEAGQDEISGEDGNDVIRGGADLDRIWGDAGNDTLYGEAGNDEILGGNGDDRIIGGDGNDAAIGELGDDYFWGEYGDDLFLGDVGNDRMNGGHGGDILFGQDGDDNVWGDEDDDILIGEDLTEDGTPIGSDTALDNLDGGTELVDGDFCFVMAAGTTVNCEFTSAGPIAVAGARSAASAPAKGTLKAAVEAKIRATNTLSDR